MTELGDTSASDPPASCAVSGAVAGGRPRPTDGGWKDTLGLGAGRVARVIVRFDGYKGRYVFHCHNLEHADMAMMANFEVV